MVWGQLVSSNIQANGYLVGLLTFEEVNSKAIFFKMQQPSVKQYLVLFPGITKDSYLIKVSLDVVYCQRFPCHQGNLFHNFLSNVRPIYWEQRSSIFLILATMKQGSAHSEEFHSSTIPHALDFFLKFCSWAWSARYTQCCSSPKQGKK